MSEAMRPPFFSAGVGDDTAAADSPSLEFVDVLKRSSSASSELDVWAIPAAAVTRVAIPALYCLFARGSPLVSLSDSSSASLSDEVSDANPKP